MTDIIISDGDIAGVKGKVIIVTGCAHGIGLATTELLLSLGARVVGGDRNPSPTSHENFTYVKVDVTKWADLLALFKTAVSKYGHLDHVCANAGIGPSVDYVSEKVGPDGDPLEPNNLTFDINLKSVSNTAYLAIQYIRKNEAGGSIVLMASASAFQRFAAVDYTSTKHGVLGLLRGLVTRLHYAKLPIRVNAIAPSWTVSGLVPGAVVEASGGSVQGPEAVAKNVAFFMADESRNGQLTLSSRGKYREIEESALLRVVGDLYPEEEKNDPVSAMMTKRATAVRAN